MTLYTGSTECSSPDRTILIIAPITFFEHACGVAISKSATDHVNFTLTHVLLLQNKNHLVGASEVDLGYKIIIILYTTIIVYFSMDASYTEEIYTHIMYLTNTALLHKTIIRRCIKLN